MSEQGSQFGGLARLVLLLWVFFGSAAPLLAHDPLDRLRKGDYDGFLDDSMRTGWVVAGVSAVGAIGLAIYLRNRLPPKPPKWPKSLKGPKAFCELGQAMAGEAGFPKTGSEAEKARYVFERMRAAAHYYNLRATMGGPGDQQRIKWSRPEEQARMGTAVATTISGVAVVKLFAGAGTLMAGPVGTLVGGGVGAVVGYFGGGFLGNLWADKAGDPEGADGLKNAGIGNCGEWSYGFSEVLGCAGIQNRVIFADKDGNPGFGGDFFRTDTALYLNDGKSRHIFDIFRQLHHDPENNLTTPSQWSDLPMTRNDVRPGDPNTPWLEEHLGGGKTFIKDHEGNVIFPR